MTPPSVQVLAALERNRRRIWAICYRMTGLRVDADDLAQEAAARAIERSDQVTEEDATGWLLRLTTRLCIDHLRHKKIERRLTELVDPVDGAEWPVGDLAARAPEGAAVLREDIRFAVVVALQRLSSRQRAALILHDVCDRSMEEVAEVLGTNANAAKATIHRARVALAEARRHVDVDVPVDRQVVEQFARAIEAGAIDALTELLAPEVWGITDGGGVIQTSTKPNFGQRAVSRQWANAKRRLDQPVTTGLVLVNGEPAIVIRLAALPEVVVAVVHLETRQGRVLALRVNRDPSKIAMVATTVH
jgi:RNA polymerase sigma-70 factor (ECF subfamily)